MNGIPVTVYITVDDVLLLSEVLENEGMEQIKKLVEKLLMCVKDSSQQLSEVIFAVDGANPYCMEKIQI